MIALALGLCCAAACMSLQRLFPSEELVDMDRAPADTAWTLSLQPYLEKLRAVPVSVSGRDVTFLVDTGCLARDVIVAEHAVHFLEFTEQPTEYAGEQRKRGTLSLWLVGSERPVQVPAVVEDIIYDGVFCAGLLERVVLSVDLETGECFIEWRE